MLSSLSGMVPYQKDKPNNGISQTIQQLYQQLHNVIEIIFDSMAIQTKYCRITRISSQLVEILGYEFEELIDTPLIDIIHPDDQNTVCQYIHSQLDEIYSATKITFRIIAKDRTHKVLHVRLAQIWQNKQYNIIWFISEINETSYSKAPTKVCPGLVKTNSILMSKVSDLTRQLQEYDKALSILAKHREGPNCDQCRQVSINLKKTVLPYLEKINSAKLDETSHTYLTIIKSNIERLVTSLPQSTTDQLQSFSVTESRVADLIQQGKTSKEIASMLNVSTAAISFHRHNIRKKLGLSNKKISLSTHLANLWK